MIISFLISVIFDKLFSLNIYLSFFILIVVFFLSNFFVIKPFFIIILVVFLSLIEIRNLLLILVYLVALLEFNTIKELGKTIKFLDFNFKLFDFYLFFLFLTFLILVILFKKEFNYNYSKIKNLKVFSFVYLIFLIFSFFVINDFKLKPTYKNELIWGGGEDENNNEIKIQTYYCYYYKYVITFKNKSLTCFSFKNPIELLNKKRILIINKSGKCYLS
jgi:hypothetical protein